MTDRPLIFSAPMVRALLDGSKTQTRRVLKLQPRGITSAEPLGHASWTITPESNRCTVDFKAPSFRRGDRVWVRETFAQSGAAWPRIQEGLGRLHYRADPDHGWQEYWGTWRPSIHMPRWASRITLNITDVRVQRLQDISEADAVAEGIERMRSGRGYYDFTVSKGAVRAGVWHHTAKDAFKALWNSLHGADAWDENPWVMALTFTVRHGNIDQVEVAA